MTDFEGIFHRANDAHILTEITSRPGTGFVDGLRFLQVETVGGIKGVLDGRVYDVFPPTRYRWSAETTYSLLGIDIVDVFEGEIYELKRPTLRKDGVSLTGYTVSSPIPLKAEP